MHPLSHPHFKPRSLRRRRHHGGRTAARRVLMAVAAVMCFGAISMARAQTAAEPRAARWKETFDQFDASDKAHALVPGGVLFVGSSSIRLWDSLEQDFQSLPVVTKRGFGGSRLSDCSQHLSRLVLPYKPRLVIVYVGDNDLAEGATLADVLASYKRFVEGVHHALPDTRIAYLSIKPSPLRAALMEQARAANTLIRDYSAHEPHLDYIDVFSKMLGDDGQPRADYFGPDRLHLSRAGYALWRQEISAHLGPLAAQQATAAASHAAP